MWENVRTAAAGGYDSSLRASSPCRRAVCRSWLSDKEVRGVHCLIGGLLARCHSSMRRAAPLPCCVISNKPRIKQVHCSSGLRAALIVKQQQWRSSGSAGPQGQIT